MSPEHKLASGVKTYSHYVPTKHRLWIKLLAHAGADLLAHSGSQTAESGPFSDLKKIKKNQIMRQFNYDWPKMDGILSTRGGRAC